MQTGKVTAVDETTGQVQVVIDQNGRVLSGINPYGIGNLTGIQFIPTEGDLVLVDDVDSFVAFITHSIVADVNVLSQTPNTVKPQAPYTNPPSLHKGELIILCKFGQTIKLDNLGNITLVPGAKGVINLGSAISLAERAVVRDGDSVTGTDSRGDTVTGTVHASSKMVYAD